MKFLYEASGFPKTKPRRSQKEWVVLLDELAAIAVKARDGFHCRAAGCKKQWLPVMLASGRVIVAEDCHWAHIVSRARGLKFRHAMNNGITLCFQHHKRYDAFYDQQKLDFLMGCGVDLEVFMDLQARAHEVETSFDGEQRAVILLEELEKGLSVCERNGIAMEIERMKVLEFYGT